MRKNEIMRYKARLVAQGFTQISGVDYEKNVFTCSGCNNSLIFNQSHNH
jgi:hypothetical protein